MSLYAKLQQRAAAGQADARRPDRRRQVRLHVPGAGAAHAGRAPGRASPTCRPTARAPTSRAWAGSRSNRRRASLDAALKAGTTHVGEDWQALVRASRDRRHRRMHRPPDRGGRPLPGGVRATASTWSTSRSRPTRSAARCWRARRREAGVIYSLAFGDQPALICDLVDWARTCGFPVVAAGRGHKWLPHFCESTPETVWGYYGLTPEQAQRGGLNPKMFNSFLDGSKPSIESTAVANATGLAVPPQRPAVSAGERGGHPVRHAADQRRRRAGAQGHGRGDLVAGGQRPHRSPTTSAWACG